MFQVIKEMFGLLPEQKLWKDPTVGIFTYELDICHNMWHWYSKKAWFTLDEVKEAAEKQKAKFGMNGGILDIQYKQWGYCSHCSKQTWIPIDRTFTHEASI